MKIEMLKDQTTRLAWAEINLSAIRHNVKEAIKAVGEKVKIMAVVKANGYGHGAEQVARAAIEAGASYLGVAIVEEGLALREAGINEPILVLAEPSVRSIPSAIEKNLTLSICSINIAQEISRIASDMQKTASIHVKVDTGMNRIGVFAEEAVQLIQKIRTMPGIKIEGIFTHFAEADNIESNYTSFQLKRFNRLLDDLKSLDICPSIKHAANSAATFLYPETHFDMVRIGISLYGLHPSEATKDKINLIPALSLKAKLSFVKQVKKGSGISYNRTHVTKEDTYIGTIPIGYGDGYSRLLSNKTEVLIKGKRYPSVGNICMDQFMIDLGKVSLTNNTHSINVGDEVVLIGKQGNEEITVDELASKIGTINYEIVCMIGARVPRVYIN